MQEGSYNSNNNEFYEYDEYAPLKCKCTKNSSKSICDDSGTCKIDDRKNAACLMLEHPHTGIHYACSSSKLSENYCTYKISKIGVKVRVCSCSNEDFCNIKKWPLNSSRRGFEISSESSQEMTTSRFYSTSQVKHNKNHHTHKNTYNKHLSQDLKIEINKTFNDQPIQDRIRNDIIIEENSTNHMYLFHISLTIILSYITLNLI
uniref:Activin_recp domain-containing protein n=1 Tax=Parastrongyloides trichosuri TaxID=131310 RepID=A0A0N5A279_PARTI